MPFIRITTLGPTLAAEQIRRLRRTPQANLRARPGPLLPLDINLKLMFH